MRSAFESISARFGKWLSLVLQRIQFGVHLASRRGVPFQRQIAVFPSGNSGKKLFRQKHEGIEDLRIEVGAAPCVEKGQRFFLWERLCVGASAGQSVKHINPRKDSCLRMPSPELSPG